MFLSAKEDIEAPIDHVFALMTDFDSIERTAMRRGIDVQRCDSQTEPGTGMEWQVEFEFRGKMRNMTLTLTEFDSPQALTFEGVSQGLSGTVSVDLVAMSKTRTRMSVDLELEASTLSARLVLQSLKLARTKINKGFHLRVANYATELEGRYRQIS